MGANDAVALWSLVATVFATVVTIAGFWISLVQIRKTRTAAESGALAMRDAANRSRHNFLLVLLPQMHALELDIDHASEVNDERFARRTLVQFSQVATQLAEVLSTGDGVDAEFVQLLRDTARSVSQAKGSLAANRRMTVRTAVSPVSDGITEVASRASALVAQYQLRVE